MKFYYQQFSDCFNTCDLSKCLESSTPVEIDVCTNWDNGSSVKWTMDTIKNEVNSTSWDDTKDCEENKKHTTTNYGPINKCELNSTRINLII